MAVGARRRKGKGVAAGSSQAGVSPRRLAGHDCRLVPGGELEWEELLWEEFWTKVCPGFFTLFNRGDICGYIRLFCAFFAYFALIFACADLTYFPLIYHLFRGFAGVLRCICIDHTFVCSIQAICILFLGIFVLFLYHFPPFLGHFGALHATGPSRLFFGRKFLLHYTLGFLLL